MKTINTTHIDTGGHGYYSVSKKDIILLGIEKEISGFSGLNFNRVYLEEDCDGNLLYNRAKEMGIEIKRKSGYNLKFNITHNYSPELFAWIPKIKDVLIINKAGYLLKAITPANLIIEDDNGKQFRISTNNPFRYIDKVLS